MPLITFTDKVDSKISTVPIINKIVADDINQLKDGVNANEIAIETINGDNYTSLVQLLNQTGTNAPVATELHNNTGETFTWSYNNEGVYRLVSTGTPFTSNKTIVFANLGSGGVAADILNWNRLSANVIIVTTVQNNKLVSGSFEVKIYS